VVGLAYVENRFRDDAAGFRAYRITESDPVGRPSAFEDVMNRGR
jgi:hypothetical protein